MREMKNSGIEWIGDIPSDWDIIPHKVVMHKQKDICEHYNGEDIISLTMGGVVVRDLTAGGKMPTTFDGYQYVEEEDLLLCLFDIDVTPRCVGVVRNNGITSPAYSRFKVHNGFYNCYYDYLLRSIDNDKVFVHLSKNLRSSLTETDFGAIKTIVPSFNEQKKISDFLDEKCAEIDTVIEKTKETIEEYKKLKQSAITQAVTKGIRPNRMMKDSGIEWIGEIPTDWETQKLKNITKLITDGTHTTPNYIDKGVPFLSIKDISSGEISFDDVKYISLEEHQLLRKSTPIEKGDMIFTRIGTLGVFVIVETDIEFDIFVSVGLIKFISSIDIDSKKFLKYFFSSSSMMNYINLVKAGGGTAAAKFNLADVRNTLFVVPSKSEQKEIVNYLDKKCFEIDELIVKKTSLLSELESYKKSLIYEYVTGKKEV